MQGGVFLATFPQWPRLVGPLYEHGIRVSQSIRPEPGVVFIGRLVFYNHPPGVNHALVALGTHLALHTR